LTTDTNTADRQTMPGMPVAFGKSPLLEAVFELRFQAAVGHAGDLLPGLLYSALKDEYPEVQPLPMANVPRELREKQPNFHYQATHRLAAASRAVQVGDRVLSLSVTSPYPGWVTFSDAIGRLLRVVSETGMVRAPERFSFRYINHLPAEPGQTQLSFLKLRIDSPGYGFTERGFHLRLEHVEDGFLTIVQVAPNTAVEGPGRPPAVGLLLDIDTIRELPGKSLADVGGDLEGAHQVAKRAFIALISEPTLVRLEPTY
jgi:uncharacterized protein (TIGR04255 family)